MSACKIGSQRPTLLHEPAGPLDWSLSDIAVEAAQAWDYELDEWQQWLVRWTFARQSGGLWAARDVGAEVPRQNGKNIWLEVVELAAILLFSDRLITHSAHRADTSHEHFLSLKSHIESCDELLAMMPTTPNGGFITSHGLEAIHFANGGRVLFKARMNSSGRGPRPQRIVFDESLVLEPEQIGSMAPGISAQPNAQLLFASSPPRANSTVQHSLRRRAIDAEKGDRLFYAAWNNPADADVTDPTSWYAANPSLGLGRMTEESLAANRKLLTVAEFAREHGGVPEEPIEIGDAVIPAGAWLACLDLQSKIETHRQWSVAVSPDRKWSAISVAGRTLDGRLHVEWMYRNPGTAWVVPQVVKSFAALKIPIRVHKAGPEGSLIPQLIEAGVEVVEVSSAEVAQATAQVVDAATVPLGVALAHIGQLELDAAVACAALRVSSDGAALWSPLRSDGDITTLKACTVAAGGVPARVADLRIW